VPRPGIAQALRAPDEQEGIRIRRDDDGDGCPDQGIALLVHCGPVGGKSPAESGEASGQWLCVWQPPPQHPPPGGGPSRLRSAGFPPEAGRAVSDMSRSSFRPRHPGHATLVSERTSWSNSA
jgi:hypothetical protein